MFVAHGLDEDSLVGLVWHLFLRHTHNQVAPADTQSFGQFTVFIEIFDCHAQVAAPPSSCPPLLRYATIVMTPQLSPNLRDSHFRIDLSLKAIADSSKAASDAHSGYIQSVRDWGASHEDELQRRLADILPQDASSKTLSCPCKHHLHTLLTLPVVDIAHQIFQRKAYQ